MNVKELTPGRELDAMVARYVMHVPCMPPVISVTAGQRWEFYGPAYSTRIEDAWQVEEVLESQGRYAAYGAALMEMVGSRDATMEGEYLEVAWVATPWALAHASPADRCRAALLVMERHGHVLAPIVFDPDTEAG